MLKPLAGLADALDGRGSERMNPPVWWCEPAALLMVHEEHPMSIPVKDSLLVPWGSNFDQKVSAHAEKYNLSPAQAAAFHDAYLPYVAAYDAAAAAREAGIRSKAMTTVKARTKQTLLAVARELYRVVQDSSTVAEADKQSVGVVVPKTHRSLVPQPTAVPGIQIVATIDNTVKLRLYDTADPTRRGRARGTEGANLFSFVGPTPPTDDSAWRFETSTGRTAIDITFGPGTPPGAKVWFTAYWFNQRKARGPAASPVGIHIPGGAAMAA